MVLYNVTVGIDLEIENEWLNWMKSVHIPNVMNTGMFVDNKIFKVLGQEEEETASYSLQYFASDIEKVNKYLEEFAPALISEHNEKYKNRHVAFRTLLQQID